jgi:hypothetical protein
MHHAVLDLGKSGFDRAVHLLGDVMRQPRLARDYREQLERFEAVNLIPAAK